MAYSDYGAFVYLNNYRQRNHEDVAVYNNAESNLPSGARIYANIIRNMDEDNYNKDDQFVSRSEQCFHGVLGNDEIRVAVYKEGVACATIFDRVNHKMYDADDIIQLAGGAPPKNYDDYKDNEYYDRYYQGYYYELVIDGYKISFSEVEENPNRRPIYKATMITPNNDEWVCFYGSQYGSGLVDCYGNEHDFDHLDGNLPGNWKELTVSVNEHEVVDNDMHLTGQVSIVYTKDNILYQGENYYIPAYDLSCDSARSTLHQDSYLSPDDFVSILNMGIDLAKQGYTRVGIQGGSWGGIETNWNFYGEFDKYGESYLNKKSEFESYRSHINERWEKLMEEDEEDEES